MNRLRPLNAVFRRSLASSSSSSPAASAGAVKTFTARASLPQASNRDAVWSSKQQKKDAAMSGPRFEQTDFSLQPNPPSAIEMIQAVPVIMVKGRKVSCNGGGGALGHPKVYINLDDGHAVACGYCGLKFQKEDSHH